METGISLNSEASRGSRRYRAKSLDAMHEVERLASSPAPRRPDAWRDDLLVALEELGASIHEQRATSGSEGSLLSDLMAEAPPRVQCRGGARTGAGGRRAEAPASPISLAPSRSTRSEKSSLTSRGRSEISEHGKPNLVYETYSVDLGVGD